MQRMLGMLCAAVWALWPAWAWAGLPGQEIADRRTTPKDFEYEVQRTVLPNGLTVLLSPDAGANHVVVDLSFAAGTLYEPADKSGLAHLVEHLLAEGDSPSTRYRALLNSRGATEFNALTTFDRLAYRVVIPPEELPLALWVNADRLGSLREELSEADLERNRRVVLQERLQQVDDMPYAASDLAMMASLFPDSHPLHAGVLGSAKSLQTITLPDALAFARRFLVPANGILTITGRFDPATAREWIDRTLAALPGYTAAEKPPSTRPLLKNRSVAVSEVYSRKPRVTLAWALDDPRDDTTEALLVGSALLTVYTDGFVGLGVNASLEKYAGGAVFVVAVTMPHETSRGDAAGNAEVVYRYLSRAVMPPDLAAATFHAMDRLQLRRLASPSNLATLLTSLEAHGANGWGLDHHWRLTPVAIQTLAARALSGPRLLIHARPINPLPAKVLR